MGPFKQTSDRRGVSAPAGLAHERDAFMRDAKRSTLPFLSAVSNLLSDYAPERERRRLDGDKCFDIASAMGLCAVILAWRDGPCARRCVLNALGALMNDGTGVSLDVEEIEVALLAAVEAKRQRMVN